jgi:hypothetical protein
MMSQRVITYSATIASLLVAASGGSTKAGVVIASGDGTPVFSLTNRNPKAVHAGNRTFFENVLGDGTTVAVLQTSFSEGHIELRDFYGSLPGVSVRSYRADANIAAMPLNFFDLLVIHTPDNAFTPTEVARLARYLQTDGSIALLGEATGGSTFPWGAETDGYINELLAGLQIPMSVDGNSDAIGTRFAVGSEIATHPLTAGVTSFEYGFGSSVSGGTPLFLNKANRPFISMVSIAVPEPASFMPLTLIGGLLASHRPRTSTSRRPAAMS